MMHALHCRDYTVSLEIGNPVKSFKLYTDTGSDPTWVQCDYEQRQGCTMVIINHV